MKDQRNFVFWIEGERIDATKTTLLNIGGELDDRIALNFPAARSFKMSDVFFKMYYKIGKAEGKTDTIWHELEQGNCFIYDEPIAADNANYPTVDPPDTYTVLPATNQHIVPAGLSNVSYFGFGKIYLNPRISAIEIFDHIKNRYNLDQIPDQEYLHLGCTIGFTFEYTDHCV